MPPPDLADKDAMIAALLARIEALVAQNASLVARVAELEACLLYTSTASTARFSNSGFAPWAFVTGQPRRSLHGRTDTLNG